jgi:hypothetical protein
MFGLFSNAENGNPFGSIHGILGTFAMNERDELRNIVRTIPNFRSLSGFLKVHFFGWFIQRFHQKEEFTEEDIRRCFQLLDSPLAMYLPVIPESATIIKTQTGYHLDWQTLEKLDTDFGESRTAKEVHHLLEELPHKITLVKEQNYLEETLTCYSHGAYRAAIVMCWNLVFSHLRNFILEEPSRLTTFNQKLFSANPKVTSISTYDDFLRLKESQVLEVCNTARIVSKNQYTILKEKLDRRNMAAHPSNIKILQLDVEHYILDCVNNVLLSL